PRFFVTGAMHRAVMRAAERVGKFIARFATKRARLHKSDMMRIRGLAAAQQAGLLHHEPKVIPVAISSRPPHRKHALIAPDLASAGFVSPANPLSTSAETFRNFDIHDLSVFGWQELV